MISWVIFNVNQKARLSSVLTCYKEVGCGDIMCFKVEKKSFAVCTAHTIVQVGIVHFRNIH